MYVDHYGLSDCPFQLTPDPRFWFDTATHRKAKDYLGYGLSLGEGFIVLTGDIGAGKTTLVAHVMQTVDRDRLDVIEIVSSQIEEDDLLRLVAAGLDVDASGMSKAQSMTAIERGLHASERSGRRTRLVVDEAQALSVASLEELHMLSNFQASGHALLQIILLGQSELRQRLQESDRLKQLRQRVIAMHHLDRTSAQEVEPYMVHRLTVVGWAGNPAFTTDAYQALFDGSDGVPGRLNHLGSHVLMFGAIEQLETIDRGDVYAVIADIAGDAASPTPAVPYAPPAAMPQTAPVDAVVDPLVLLSSVHMMPRTGSLPVRSAFDAGGAAPSTMPFKLRLTTDGPAVKPVESVVPNELVITDAATLGSVKRSADAALVERVASLEMRIEEQEAALRRMLTLLIDSVEGEGGSDVASLRLAAAAP